ncbi:hypothetical protein [Oryza sativa Japonica Group]|uniref:Uncharacterized protein n=2 Tax=Oryza sativa subsp. japonica TaxID=39947 RepID=Q7F783_ORYSJ|nr:hypothetical protein [Oryza sativa Japonica Group]BAB92123.1 hypothetical protein [Oryza sativa Japonica Group]
MPRRTPAAAAVHTTRRLSRLPLFSPSSTWERAEAAAADRAGVAAGAPILVVYSSAVACASARLLLGRHARPCTAAPVYLSVAGSLVMILNPLDQYYYYY